MTVSYKYTSTIFLLFISILSARLLIPRRSPPTMSSLTRSVVKSVLAIETEEVAGAVVRRFVGTVVLRNPTPFLTLKHFRIGNPRPSPQRPGHRHILQATHFPHSRRQHGAIDVSLTYPDLDIKILPVTRELLNLEDASRWPLAK